jgi:glycosyltransferase involved in cell wall biosynthesis
MCGTTAVTPLEGASLDATVAGGFIEHLSEGDVDRALRHFARVLRAVGTLCMTPTEPAHWSGRWSGYVGERFPFFGGTRELHDHGANEMSQTPRPTSGQAEESFHVAIAGLALTEPLAQFLEGDTDSLPAGVGGASSVVWQLASNLVSRGQHVSLVTLDQAVSASVTASGPLLNVVYGPHRPRHSMRDLMRVERHAVRDGILRTRPDLVHAHWCYEYALGAFASGIPTLVTVHDWMPTILRLMEARYWPYWSGRLVLYFTVLARAKYLTANSPYTADKVRPFTRASLEVVPNGVADGDFFIPGGQEALAQPRPACSPVIISVNNGFSPWKNVRRLLEAYRTLRQRGIECALELIGDEYEPCGPCDAWARQRRLAEDVTFLGPLPRDEVLARMREATLLAHPAREESFGMTLIEAMSQRVPVIGGARSGAVPWVLGGGKAGMLVDVDDPRALAQAMEAVLTHPALMQRLASGGFRHAWDNFRQSRVTDLYLDIYRRLLVEEARK